jgi:hypothetical protein
MTSKTTRQTTAGILAATVAAAALLVPSALARPDSWLPPEQLASLTSTSYPDVFERAALRSGAQFGGVENYRDSGRTGLSATATDAASTGRSVDWSLVGTFSALAALCAVLAVGTLVTMRPRVRLA